MKKIVITALILTVNVLSSAAFDDFIITSENAVTGINNKTPDIIQLKLVTTLMNEKNTVVIEVLKEGCGEFSLTTDDKTTNFKIFAKPDKTELKTKGNYKVYQLDKAPGVYELDPPPGVIWNK